MNPSELFPYIDHTQLKAYCTWEDIAALCQEALAFHTASVCIPPSYVARAHNTFGPSLNICTVTVFLWDTARPRASLGKLKALSTTEHRSLTW